MGERCHLHPNTAASAPCAGCKLPACATCLSEGRHGFCQACVEKALGLSQQAPSAPAGMAAPKATVVMKAPSWRGTGELPPVDAPKRGTGELPPLPEGPKRGTGELPPLPQAKRGVGEGFAPDGRRRGTGELPPLPEGAEGAKRAPRPLPGDDPTLGKGYGGVAPPPGKRGARPPEDLNAMPSLREVAPRDPNMCFLHRDTRAAAKCLTCNRAYCPVCLNTAGICGHCTTHKAEAQAILFSPNARGQAVLNEIAEQEAKKRFKLRDALLIGAAALALLVGWKVLHKPEAKVDPTIAIFQKLEANELSAAEKAQLAALHGQRRVDIPAPPPPSPLPVVQPMGAMGGAAPAQAAGARSGGGGGRVAYSGGGAARPGAVARAVRVGLVVPGTVRGLTTVGASVSGQPGRVDLLVDGAFVDSRSAPPYRFSWATQAHGNGPHTLTLEARGEAGLLSRASRRVVVAN